MFLAHHATPESSSTYLFNVSIDLEGLAFPFRSAEPLGLPSAMRHVDELGRTLHSTRAHGRGRAEGSERLFISCPRKYVIVFANRSTKNG